MFYLSIVQEAMQRALADGALQPIETQAILLDSDGVRFVVRAVSNLARKDEARDAAAATDPLGNYDRSLFIDDLAPSHYVLLNKFPLIAGHVLIVTRRFERQQRLLTVQDFAALIACLSEVDGLVFYNGGIEAGASQPRKPCNSCRSRSRRRVRTKYRWSVCSAATCGRRSGMRSRVWRRMRGKII